MKILQIGPYPPPFGGWAYHIKLLKDYMLEKGLCNDVLNLGTNNRKIKSREYIDVQNGLDFAWKNIVYNSRGYSIYFHVDGGPIKGLILNLVSEILALLFGRRITVNFHAGIYQKCFEEGRWFRRFLAKLVLGLAKQIICNSEPVKKRIVSLGISADKIHPIAAFSHQYMNFSDTMKPGQSSFFESHGPILITYLFYRKEYTVDMLLKLVDLLKGVYPDIGLVIVGGMRDSEEHNNHRLTQEEIQRMDLSEHIYLDSGLNHDNYLTLVKNSDIFVRTPKSDGVSASVLEALSLCVPVVASENGTRPDNTITFAEGDENDLCSKIKYVLENKEAIRQTLKKFEVVDTLKEELDVLLSKGNRHNAW